MPVDAREDAQRAREVFFAAIRACVEGLARERPLVLIWEDIHWADEGMLDLIEHLVQWVRAPVLQVCLARDELLERRAGWGGVRRDATTVFLDPLGEDETRELISLLLDAGDGREGVIATVAARAEGNPLFAEEMVRRLAEEDGASAAELPATVQGLLAARLDSLEPFQRRLLAHASVVGRTFWEDALVPVAAAEGGDLAQALRALRERDLLVVGEGAAFTGEPELAFKHALIRDVAYEMLPKAVRAAKHFEVGEFIETRAGERVEEVVALLAEHYGRAAQLGQELGLAAPEMQRYRQKALAYLEAAGDAARAFYSNAEALANYEAALEQAGEDEEAVARVLEKQGDVALRLGRVDLAIEVWERALDFHGGREDLERVAELHRKIGAALAHKGERKQAIEHHQRGINLIKDGEPSLALVRLYEEAAWLYMQTGDNMLAIYASEKALRLAERLGEVGAASRAHGIFGRVFGRIGDTVKARENLERAVDLARGSDAHETVLALLALGHHLESSDGDYAAAASAYAEALALAQQVGDVPAEIELHAAVAQLALYEADWEARRRAQRRQRRALRAGGADRQAVPPYALRGRLHWRAGEWQESERSYRRAHELAEQMGWSEVCFDALYGLSTTLRDQGESAGAESALAAGARGMRARRPDRAVDPGERRARARARPRRPRRRSRRGGRRGGGARRARALPGRRGGGATRRPAGRARCPRRSATWRPRTGPGRRWDARSTLPAASCSSASGCSRRTRSALRWCWRVRPPYTTSSAWRTWPRARGSCSRPIPRGVTAQPPIPRRLAAHPARRAGKSRSGGADVYRWRRQGGARAWLPRLCLRAHYAATEHARRLVPRGRGLREPHAHRVRGDLRGAAAPLRGAARGGARASSRSSPATGSSRGRCRSARAGRCGWTTRTSTSTTTCAAPRFPRPGGSASCAGSSGG